MRVLCVRVVLALATLGAAANSFCTSKVSRQKKPSAVYSLPSAEESAQALSDYMVKSHTEKLKAIKVVEEQKQAEIEILKAQLDALKRDNTVSVSVQPPLSTPTDTVEVLQQQLTSYQSFMAKYIVEAQEAKYHSVREAEAAVAAKYEAKIAMQKGDAPPAAAATTKAEAALPSYEERAFEDRNGKIIASAVAGKSRWGDAEVEKLKDELKKETVMQVTAPVKEVVEEKIAKKPLSKTTPVDPKPPKGEKPLKGEKSPKTESKKKDKEAPAPSEPVAPTPPQASQEEVFLERNTLIATAGPKSRWGPMEVAKAQKHVSTAPEQPVITITPEIEAADHGLRADGGVGGPSLAERVNLGAELLGQ